MSFQPSGFVRDCQLWTIASSKGNEGWKRPPFMAWLATEFWAMFMATVAALSVANGSMLPTGAKISNESAASVGGGLSEFVGEG